MTDRLTSANLTTVVVCLCALEYFFKYNYMTKIMGCYKVQIIQEIYTSVFVSDCGFWL